LAGLIAVAAAALGDSLAAQAPALFRAGVDLVTVAVTVLDAQGQCVSGLDASAFGVIDEGAEQSLAVFTPGTAPLDLLLLIDTSDSMTERLDAARHAAVRLVRALGSQDRAGVMAFGDRAELRQPLTRDRGAPEKAIAGLRVGGSTALHDALYVAVNQMAQSGAGDSRRRAVVVLSDGDDTTSLVSFDVVRDLVRRAGIGVYTISLAALSAADRPVRFSTEQFDLRRLAYESGASSYMPLDVTALDGIYDAIARELACQYALGFVPRDASTGSRFHHLSVLVRAPHRTVRARSGYFAEPATAGARRP
jgi:Ca-activated chloride channel homolog